MQLSTAVALLITGITGMEGKVMFLGMTGVMWVSFIFVSAFQVYLFLARCRSYQKILKLCWNQPFTL